MPPQTRSIIQRLVLLMCIACLPARFSFADAPTTAPTETNPTDTTSTDTLAIIKGWLTQLSDRNPAQREAAREQLMGIAPSDLPTLRTAVEQMRPLPPGVSNALHEIVTHVFLAERKLQAQNAADRSGDPSAHQGFMGVMMRNYEAVYPNEDQTDADLPLGVVVDSRLPGFAAYRALHNGDVILAISADKVDELRVHSADDVSAPVSQLRAGSHVQLWVLRHGRRVEVEIILDARPVELRSDQQALKIDQYRQTEQEKAQSYWKSQFAPVVDPSIS